ncbi:hypothetical protein WJ32_29235 [Burkholderia ubonensis]|nr:hypothetical protein [Burkholderia ubonensis]AOJ66452.1 hypothetical protein WJ32_29235 [Burkholderia ubonensis]
MRKKFKDGQRVKFNQTYRENAKNTYQPGDSGTVVHVGTGWRPLISVKMDSGAVTTCFAARLDLIEELQFKAGDLVTPNFREHDRSFQMGKPYTVREYKPAISEGHVAVIYFESDDYGNTGRFRPADYYVPYVAHSFKIGDTVRVKNPEDFGGGWNGPMEVDWVFPWGHVRAIHPERGVGGFLPNQVERIDVHQKQPEPTTEFRIRKHGTALREVRGTPFATQQEAEQAVSRYTPGSIYEIVEVKVVRTVKVEQEVRVIDYKEAA